MEHPDPAEKDIPVTRRSAVYLLVLASALSALLVTGCAPRELPQAEAPQQGAGSDHLSPASGSELEMSAEQKTAELNSTFPVEFPVMAGQVLAAETVSGTELSYQVLVSAPLQQVVEWHRSILGQRAFALMDEAQADDGSVVLTYRRGDATYALRIEPTSDKTATVVGTLGFSRAAETTPAP